MSVTDQSRAVAGAALKQERIRLGPWQGSMRSVAADNVPPDYIAQTDTLSGSVDESHDFLYLPRSGTWKRRGGTVQKFDTFGSSTGLLPSKWSGKCRQLEEFISDDISDHIPTLIALVTRETVSTGLDDGRFSVIYVRDQVNSVNYTVGSEFSTTTYPSPGTEATYKVVPLWYDSGQGGITRGVEEFQRRFFWSGSRRIQKVGRWTYAPSVLGTPARFLGMQPLGSTSTVFPATSSPDESVGTYSIVGGGGTVRATFSDSSDLTYIGADVGGSNGIADDMYVKMAAISPTPTAVTVHIRARRQGAGFFDFLTIYGACGAPIFGGANPVVDSTVITSANITTSFVEYTLTLTALQITNIAAGSGGWANMYLGLRAPSSNTCETDVSAMWLTTPSSDADKRIRIIPSGPLPPIHAGTLAAGTAIDNPTSIYHPTSDVSDGTFLGQDGGSSLFSYLDETTIDDADYVQTPSDTTDSQFTVAFSGITVAPTVGDTVVMRIRFMTTGGGALTDVNLYEGANLRAARHQVQIGVGAFTTNALELSANEIASVSDWTQVRIAVSKSHAAIAGRLLVSYLSIEHTPVSSLEGGWRGFDTFYYSVAYRFEDDSIWAPCTPRSPLPIGSDSTILPNGYNLFSVNSSNLSAGYNKITWSNIPIGPYGVKSRLLLRTPKIDSRTESTLQLNPTDLRLVWEIQDNTTTSYDDFFADDDSLTLDPDGLFIRDDHKMTPRSRYIFAGDSRVCVSYGGLNPCAIELAPVDYAGGTTYDRNLDDENANLWGTNAFYYRVTSTALELYSDTGSALSSATSFSFASSSYNTLEKLVDAINSTTISGSAKAWRAQLCPGAPAQADPATSLTPTVRVLDTCTVSGQTIARASGLSAVAVGNYITGSGVTDGAYVSVINSDVLLTFVGTITSGSKTLTFVPGTGDTVTGASNAYGGYVRALAGSLPSFLFLNKTALDREPLEKNAVWMTVASPGSSKSAANCFSGKTTNKHTPPLEAGISMGGRAVDNGFVVPFSQKRAVIRNTRDTGSGFDADYRLFITNEASGCAAWQSLASGTRCAVMFTPEGWIACDLYNEALISEAIYQARPNNLTTAVTSIGDFGYEAAASIAATGADTDTAYMIARVMRNVLHVNYRSSSSATRPDRQVRYDFSSGMESAGLAALVREPGRPWGWSVPLQLAFTAMTEGRRSDGSHLYGWNDANAGSTGDGRIDEFETTETDNGTAISATITTPWLRVGSNQLSAQEMTVEHSTPSGATVALDFHRSYSDETYSFTPSTSSTLIVSRDIKLLSLPARATTAACYIGWRQTAGTASELRRIELRVKSLPSYR